MSTFLPRDVQAGLDAARADRKRRASRLRVVVGGVAVPIFDLWKNGFSAAADVAPKLRGFVDVYEGSVHLFQCLVIAGEEGDHGEIHFEFKRATAVSTDAPLDFARLPDAPVALIGIRR